MAIAQQAQEFNRKPSKQKKPRFSHTDNTKYGMGDNYGTAIKAKLGKVRDGTVGMAHLDRKQISTPPRSLA